MADDLLKEVRKELKKNVDAKTAEDAQRVFKEKIKFYGVKVADVNKISAAFYQKHIEKLSKTEIFDLCGKLWESGYIEESFIACNWAYFTLKRYEKKDFKVFESWLRQYVTNWASCDTLCNHTVAEAVEMYPELVNELKKWAGSQNRWERRGAAVTLIIPARKGLFLEDIFAIAGILLADKDDLVQKGYGWMLKAASQAHQKEVFAYVMRNKKEMPRTALRYAIEKMPSELKKKAMAK